MQTTGCGYLSPRGSSRLFSPFRALIVNCQLSIHTIHVSFAPAVRIVTRPVSICAVRRFVWGRSKLSVLSQFRSVREADTLIVNYQLSIINFILYHSVSRNSRGNGKFCANKAPAAQNLLPGTCYLDILSISPILRRLPV